tara:strand:+ start:129 stop:353 length:225 start_codon:yes stop_codon:yes gene_type:complete
MTELGIEFTRLLIIFFIVFGISLLIGAGLEKGAEKIAQVLGFGDQKKLSFVLDNLYQDLEGGQAINVKEYFDET